MVSTSLMRRRRAAAAAATRLEIWVLAAIALVLLQTQLFSASWSLVAVEAIRSQSRQFEQVVESSGSISVRLDHQQQITAAAHALQLPEAAGDHDQELQLVQQQQKILSGSASGGAAAAAAAGGKRQPKNLDHKITASSSLPHAFREAPAFRNDEQCVSVNRSKSSSSDSSICGDSNVVHIAMTLDMGYFRGSIAVVYSILKHAACPENVIFHFLAAAAAGDGNNDVTRDSDTAASLELLRSLIDSTFPFLVFKVYRFDESLVKSRISASVRVALEHPLNYARIYLGDILESCIKRVIYLDSDLIVVDDIVKLWDTRLEGSRVIGAPEYCHANLTNYFTDSFWNNKGLSSPIMSFKPGRSKSKPCYFNTGVMVMDLVKWRQQNYRATIENWMKRQKQSRIYELGSLPPFLLVFAGQVQPIDHRWNQHGLGGDNLEGRCRPLHPGPVSLLHWSGKGKPWMRLDAKHPCPVDSLWIPYDLLLPPSSYS
ncbi:unnamed protein product [Sphagnum jensenii]|uniref:Hexosyltransferase n=1 Tax=Sphagnum jensenii TaxID=128206 RepID=A0ABP0WWP1_9BRYO